jgi:methylase of polypeptide subunit release factors
VALDGGGDGLDVISVLLKQARDWLHPNGFDECQASLSLSRSIS